MGVSQSVPTEIKYDKKGLYLRIMMEAKMRMKSALKRLFLAKCRISVELRRGV